MSINGKFRMGINRAELKNTVAERRQTPEDRWTRQAAELRARFLPRALAHNFPRLEFLRQAGVSYRVNHRWQNFAARFYPQIHLAILPLLRETLWPDRGAMRARSEYARAPAPQTTGRPAPEAAAFKAYASAESPAMAHRVNPVSAQPDFIDHTSTLAKRLRRYTMQRQVEIDESRLEVTVRHLTQRVRRMEERLPGAPQMVVHKPAPTVVAAERREMPEPERFQRPPQVRDAVSESPWAKAATAPSLSIEQLTDHVIRQIDSRVIAMRERMGRI